MFRDWYSLLELFNTANMWQTISNTKYLLFDGGVFSLKFSGSSLDRSLFMDTCEPDLTLMTQRTERKHFTNTGDTLVSFEKV